MNANVNAHSKLQPGEARIKYPWIDVGLGLRNQMNALFEDARRMGCTVTYWRQVGLISTVYHDVVIVGPEGVVRRVHRIISDQVGRLI